MSYERQEFHRRASELFLELCDDRSPERWDRLERACAEDRELLREVRSLVQAHERLTGFLAEAPEPLEPVREVRPPGSVGRFRVLEVLGRGGMGVVYLAEQDHPRRQVALKVLQPGLASPEHRRRFEYECEVLGKLQHPGIAQIHEAGSQETDAGVQPWFAMELVRGRPLDQHALERGLGLRERLELLVRIGAAVQHAHHHGIVHRDLKPANILVDETGQPKVLDFGIARAVEQDGAISSALTSRGELLGTLPYMSPEHLEGDPARIDTRTDVYALGVIAYQLLSGKLPHPTEGKSLLEVARAIRDAEPAQLDAGARAVPADLATVVAKALEKDPARRYGSVAALTADIERFLRHEPVLARTPSAAYHLAKFARRHRVVVGALGAVIVSMSVGVIVAWTKAGEARRETLAANEARGKAASADIERFLRHEPVLARTPSAAYHLAKFARRHRVVVGALAAVLVSLTAGVIVAWNKTGVARRETLAANEARGKAASAASLAQQEALRASQEAARATEEAARASGLLNLWMSTLAASHEGREFRVLDAVDAFAGRFEQELANAPRERAMLRSQLAQAYLDFGEYEKLRTMVQKGVEDTASSLEEDEPEALLARTYAAELQRMDGDLASAEASYRDLIARHERTVGPRNQRTIGCVLGLGETLIGQARYAEAESLLAPEHELAAEVLGESHPTTLQILCKLGSLARYAGEFDTSQRRFERYLALSQEHLGPEDRFTREAWNGLATVAFERGAYDRALELMQRASDSARAQLGPEHDTTLTMLENLAKTFEKLGRQEEAEALLRECLAVRERVFGPEDSDTLWVRDALGSHLALVGRIDEGVEWMQSALEARRRTIGPEHPDTLTSEFNLASSLGRLGKLEEALELSRHVVEGRALRFGEGHPELLVAQLLYDHLLVAKGEYAEALSELEPLLESLQSTFGPDHPRTLRAHTDLGGALGGLKRFEEGERVLQAGRRLAEQRTPFDVLTWRDLSNTLAGLYDDWKKPEEAQRVRDAVAARN